MSWFSLFSLLSSCTELRHSLSIPINLTSSDSARVRHASINDEASKLLMCFCDSPGYALDLQMIEVMLFLAYCYFTAVLDRVCGLEAV